MPEIHSARTRDLDVVTLHDLFRLRQDVFVVEQECVYADVDGRDLEPGTVQVWATGDDGTVVATLRVLAGADGTARIGRVATAVTARGKGLAAGLVRAAVALGDAAVVLDAQSHLEQWYARLGFVRAGEDFVEDGIPHVPMCLDR